jgi:hypothetical protein
MNKQKASTIIHGLKESTEAGPAKREESDEDKIVSMLNKIYNAHNYLTWQKGLHCRCKDR